RNAGAAQGGKQAGQQRRHFTPMNASRIMADSVPRFPEKAAESAVALVARERREGHNRESSMSQLRRVDVSPHAHATPWSSPSTGWNAGRGTHTTSRGATQ